MIGERWGCKEYGGVDGNALVRWYPEVGDGPLSHEVVCSPLAACPRAARGGVSFYAPF